MTDGNKMECKLWFATAQERWCYFGDLRGGSEGCWGFLMSYCGKKGKLKYTQHLAKNRSVRVTEVIVCLRMAC